MGGKVVGYCSICNSMISGKYTKYSNGFKVCNHCYHERPHCDICSIPVGKHWEINSNIFCNDCYNNKPRCSICSVPMGAHYYRGDKLFCKDCYENGIHCKICKIPVSKYYERNSMIYCPDCYSKYPKCSVCGNIVASYVELEGFIACNDCDEEIKKYNVTLQNAQVSVSKDDILRGDKLLKNIHHSHLCDVSNLSCIKKLSQFISSYSKSDFEYVKECYYLCREEIEYLREARWSPIECIVKGKGNCSSKSGLLASLLKAKSIKVNFCEIPEHVYVVAHLPDMPKWCQMFAAKQKNDGTNWIEWMGMDPASNYTIGNLPKSDFTKVELKKF